MRRTIHAARYLSDPVYRRKISWQLNKGESLHALRPDLHYAQQDTIARPHLQDWESRRRHCGFRQVPVPAGVRRERFGPLVI